MMIRSFSFLAFILFFFFKLDCLKYAIIILIFFFFTFKYQIHNYKEKMNSKGISSDPQHLYKKINLLETENKQLRDYVHMLRKVNNKLKGANEINKY